MNLRKPSLPIGAQGCALRAGRLKDPCTFQHASARTVGSGGDRAATGHLFGPAHPSAASGGEDARHATMDSGRDSGIAVRPIFRDLNFSPTGPAPCARFAILPTWRLPGTEINRRRSLATVRSNRCQAGLLKSRPCGQLALIRFLFRAALCLLLLPCGDFPGQPHISCAPAAPNGARCTISAKHGHRQATGAALGYVCHRKRNTFAVYPACSNSGPLVCT